jgi:hypothetical protein
MRHLRAALRFGAAVARQRNRSWAKLLDLDGPNDNLVRLSLSFLANNRQTG